MTRVKTTLAAAAAATALALSGAAFGATVADEGALVHLSGEATRTLVNDEATVTFSVERQHKDVRRATDEVVRAGNAALEALKPFGEGVAAETSDFSTWPVYTKPKDGEAAEIGSWGVRQTIRVKVSDVKEVARVMEAAGATMGYDGIAFGVSKPVLKRINAELLAEAVRDATARAAVAAEALGLTEKDVTVEELSVGTGNAPSVRYYGAPRVANDRMLKAATAPVVAAGTSEVTLRVSMRVRIKD